MKAYKIIVIGRVQGVGFRYYTNIKAAELGIKGTIANTSDGNVLIYAEGDSKNMELFKNWCENGPKLAKVIQIICTDVSATGYQIFEIIE